jgi:uncharacterized FAD-dependent dehydrogenase
MTETLRITNLRMRVEESERALHQAVARKVRVSADDLQRFRILRRSLDARKTDRLEFVYSVAIDVPEGAVTDKVLANSNIGRFDAPAFEDLSPGSDPMTERPVVIGSGPAGLLAGFYLAERGYRPIILERGQPVKERVPEIRKFDRGGDFNRENNYLFGEGGAGCFSDGKLTCRITGPDVDWVLQRFVDCGGRDSLIYEHRPHLGSNKLPMICRNFRRKIESMGGEYQFGCRFEGFNIEDGQVRSINTSSGEIKTRHVILAIGHSARDTYEMMHASGIPMEAKAFQLGVRIEHPQENINKFKYGKDEYLTLLGAADYSIVAKGERDLFSFCMCAGGIVMPSISEPGMFCSNGMSNSRHDSPLANSGLVVTLQPEEFGSDHPLAGVELQRKFERAAFELAGSNYHAPIQSAADFLKGRNPNPDRMYDSTYERGVRPLNLLEVLPEPVVKSIQAGLPVMDKKWRGKFLKDANLIGPEMRGSSPVRIPRSRESFQCPGIDGLYPAGEGAGYAGGIVTAAVDGLRCAKAIARDFAPIN